LILRRSPSNDLFSGLHDERNNSCHRLSVHRYWDVPVLFKLPLSPPESTPRTILPPDPFLPPILRSFCQIFYQPSKPYLTINLSRSLRPTRQASWHQSHSCSIFEHETHLLPRLVLQRNKNTGNTRLLHPVNLFSANPVV